MEINKKKLITHNGSFHADDVFATAVLSLMLEKNNQNLEIIRTRDPEVIKNGDYVFDVGGIYDEDKNRFDHHQKDFKEKRENGILYSSFGLVWKKFGKELIESEKEIKLVDEKLVAPIDASDNGFDLVENKYNISPYYIESFFYSMRPSWSENDLSNDQMFLKSVEIAKEVLSREIIQAKDSILVEELVLSIYKNTKNKRIIVLNEDYPYEYVLNKFPEPLFVIYPRTDNVSFGVRAIREDPKTFKNRKNFPISWAGLRDEELQKITGVEDAIFCHRALFLAVAKTKEGAIKLAELALNS
jgi:uncharacterized UPF0160 family protein